MLGRECVFGTKGVRAAEEVRLGATDLRVRTEADIKITFFWVANACGQLEVRLG
jgi:hypothetical protein